MQTRVHALLAILMFVLPSCATTTTRIAPVSPERVRAEEARQREIVLREIAAEQHRLDSLAFPLLIAAADVCGEKHGPVWGFRVDGAQEYEGPWREAVLANGLEEGIVVTSVIAGSAADRGGLRRGDRIIALDGDQLSGKRGAVADLRLAFAAVARARGGARVEYERAAVRHSTVLEPDSGCAVGTIVTPEGGINAFADGRNIIFPWAMMRFADDTELRVVIGHEIAHNAMRHIEARKKNALFGAILGALGDVALASQGVNTGGQYAAEFAAAGARAYSQDFEREADYVGLYILARAGLPLENAPMLWRHFAQIDPGSIAYASTHPTTAERFVRLEATAKEIERKRAAGQPLLPEMKAKSAK
ncbi:MAG: M48 family metalloprotease [Longimicrobiales bacterium]